MPKLTKRAVEALRPEPDREVFAWDNELRGFGVRLRPSGASSYIIQYRNSEGRSRRLTLGSLQVLTPEQARGLARDKLGLVCKGEDPADERKALRGAPTVSQVCDWYLEEAGAGRLLGRKRRPVAATTLALDRSRIDTHVRPLLGTRMVRALTIADLETFQAHIASGKTAKERVGRGGVTTGGTGVAGRTLGMLHTIFEQAARWGVIETNPAKGARKVAGDNKRERRLSAAEVTALGQVMRKARDESPTAAAAVTLMLLTGFRRMEALALRREWIDAGASCVRFPQTKTGAQVRPIGQAALRLLQMQPILGNSAFVFPGEIGNDHFVGVSRVLTRLSVAAKLEPVTPHLLRHTFASFAGDLGYSELTVAALLGHASRGVTQRYVHLDKATQLAADEVCRTISELLEG
ncbi:tyrosine-type recombinase/integrase [Aurantimonas aggregata]|uniref:Tyrosine-type recombinase/integrase n=1 Tax=Aurantimonas aggregata TaxID=2047720 RepID=A0A6L9MML3_9HYPH|nr:site-specific integrase [Aurantimonas aggregata]NDV88856.1 tyrosine-type recombinase/integrase [Aurantimonas aggregata]